MSFSPLRQVHLSKSYLPYYLPRPLKHGYRQGKKLGELSALGHFLKGSSAALGITKVQNTCEEIQHYGKKEDVKASRELTEADALGRIQVCVKRGKGEYKVARAWLEAWFKKAKATNE